MKQVTTTINASIKNDRLQYLKCNQLKLSKRGIFTLLISFALLMGSCQKSDNKVTVLFKGGFDTMESVVSINGDNEHNRITGVGQLTDLGKSTFVADIEFSLVDFSAPITGVQTTVLANGDKIFSTFTGTASYPDAKGNIQAILSETITGGTGKFIKVTGTFTVTANGNINVPEGKNTFDGTISY
ncbi:MAG TPA: hypothetical protein VIJ95_17015 [Hanamia sp.]